MKDAVGISDYARLIEKEGFWSCPFCGEDPDTLWQEDGTYYVKCQNFWCGPKPCVIKPTRSGAVLAWNQRPE